MSTERSITEELASQTDSPGFGIPREQLLALAMLARTTAAALRDARERHGRAAWNDADEAARIHLAVDAAAIDELTVGQAREWNQKVATGDVRVFRVGDTGLVIAGGELSDGSEVVQATLDDRTVTVAAGSAGTAAHVREWLAANPNHDALSDLRQTARDIAEDRASEETFTEAAATDRQTATATDGPETTTDTVADDDGTSESPTLRDRLQGRVPESVFADPRWGTAEKQFHDLVADGADPDVLADAAAKLNFTEKVRTPAGLVAWQMRKAAQGNSEPTDWEQARREAAVEFLANAGDTPTDRARASRLLGQFDQDFDRALAEKYPGILTAPDPEGRWHDHNQRAATKTDLAAEHRDNARRADDGDLAIVPDPGPDTAAAEETGEAIDHAHTAADERDLAANADSDRAEQAASVRAASAPLTRGPATQAAQTRGDRDQKRNGARRAHTTTQTRTRGRTQ